MKVRIFKIALFWSCYFFFIGNIHLSHANTGQPIFLIDTLFAENVLDTQFLYILPDPNNSFSLKSIQEQTFLPLVHFAKSTNRDASTSYWTKLIIHNQMEIAQEYWLAINAHKSYGYQVRASGEILSSQTGSMLPHKEKTIQAIQRKLANYLPLKLKAGEKSIFYIRNEYTGFRTGLKDVLRIETPLNVQYNQIKERGYQNFFNGFFQAILILLFLYCFFYAYYAKEQFAIYLGLYCFTYCIYFLNSEGYLYAISEIKNRPVLFDLVSLNLINVAIIFECLFIQHFLSLKTILPKWNKFFKGFILSQILVLFIASAYYLSTSNILPPIILVSLFQLLFLITRPFFLYSTWQLPDTKALIYTYSSTVGLLFSMAALFAIFFPFFIDSLLLLKLGVGGFISIMLIGLSYNAAKYRTDKLRFEKENIQQQLVLEQQQSRQKAIEQEKELLQVRTKELQELDQLKSHFFANVSHELRTPLTLLLSPIQRVLKSNDLSPRNDSLLRLAQQNGQRLLQLTNEILNLNKLEAGKLALQLSKVVLFNFLKRIIAAFQSHAESAKIELIFQYELDKYLQVKLDKKKTETVLINLLSNALKFTPSKGKVTIIAKDYQQYLQVTVQDTGRGIHPDDLPHIFNRFFQTKQADRQAEGGTGIGLALSQELAKLMNGSLQVSSEVNLGSTFILALPHIEVMAKLSDEAARLVLDNQLDQKNQVAKVGATLKV